ncbi:hypothetical protein HRbin29_01982 [bacterium HR29]|nr:hypothetical protein HRbin29_01982 [bacterium HR29]
MPDLTAPRAPEGPNLPDREGREVVVVHEPLRLIGRQRIELLGHAQIREGGDGENLRLASLEEAAAVGAGKDAHLDVERTDVLEAAPIGAPVLFEDAAPHLPLDHVPESLRDFHRGEAVAEDLEELGTEGLVGIASLARRRRHHLIHPVLQVLGDGGDGLFRLLRGGVGLLGDAELSLHLALDGVDGPVRLHGALDRLENLLLAALLRPGLHHHDRFVGAGDDDIEDAGIGLLEGGVDDVLAVDEGDTDRADGAVEGDIADGESRTGTDRDQGVGLVLPVGRERHGDDLDFVPEPFGEEGAKGPVGEAHGENRLGARPGLAAGEGAGDAAGGVQPLLVVDGEGEEVDALASLGHTGRHENNGVALADGHGTIRLVGEEAVLDDEGLSAHFNFVSSDHGSFLRGL